MILDRYRMDGKVAVITGAGWASVHRWDGNRWART